MAKHLFNNTEKQNSENHKNVSGRNMVKYSATKSDPICKWRTATVGTTIELVSWLPKESMSKKDFREYMRTHLNIDFFHTAYQLAAQLGLYYEDKDIFIPRFDHDISEFEAREYLIKWMQRYYVPNPFTKRGFVGVEPSINLLYGLVDYLDAYPHKPNLATAGVAIFGGEMGNIGSVKYVLNEFSQTIFVDTENNMKIIQPRRGKVEVENDRNDKKAFFDHFK